jgi:hypothetical protein
MINPSFLWLHTIFRCGIYPVKYKKGIVKNRNVTSLSRASLEQTVAQWNVEIVFPLDTVRKDRVYRTDSKVVFFEIITDLDGILVGCKQVLLLDGDTTEILVRGSPSFPFFFDVFLEANNNKRWWKIACEISVFQAHFPKNFVKPVDKVARVVRVFGAKLCRFVDWIRKGLIPIGRTSKRILLQKNPSPHASEFFKKNHPLILSISFVVKPHAWEMTWIWTLAEIRKESLGFARQFWQRYINCGGTTKTSIASRNPWASADTASEPRQA